MKLALFATTAAVVVAATAASGCSTADVPVVEPVCSAQAFPPPHTEVWPCSASDVLRAAVTTLYQLDPVVGMDARSMFEAARPLIRAAYSTDTRIGASLWSPITVALWQDWVEHHIPLRTEVRLTGDDHPPDTATSSSRILTVTLTPAERTPIVFSVYARSTRHAAERAWLLAEIQVV
ncbi:hypothetical protein ACFWPX_03290 [Nocardia sp. NPDC058518]|uniref:hypothetical protein n=1 Tax=Nocardia sp. NPDC058518 TaxID=3346534 RepID=UPI0036655CCB